MDGTERLKRKLTGTQDDGMASISPQHSVKFGQIRNELRKGCFQWHTDSFRRTTYQRFKAVLVAYHKSRTSLTLTKKAGAENR